MHGKKAWLTNLQQRFQQHLLTPEADLLIDVVATTPRVPRATRLQIYSNAYRERLVEAMDSDYHQLHVFLGDDAFTQLIYAYLKTHPSRQPLLRWFGAQLPEFLRQTQPYCRHAELAELAEFEWALCHAFDAAEGPVANLEQLRTLAPENLAGLTLSFHPSLQELSLHCKAPVVWQALNENPLAPPPSFEWPLEARTWLVWRQALRLMFRPAADDEAWAIGSFRSGQTFDQFCEGLCRWHVEDQVPQRGVTLLQQWLNEELVAGLTSTAA